MARTMTAAERYWIGEDLRGYNPERHDPDSIFFDDSYVGPSERKLSGGCNRCGGFDDCYCDDPSPEPVAAPTDAVGPLVKLIREELGRKFIPDDLANGGSMGTDLYDFACAWLPTQINADFEWLSDLAKKYARGGGLTDRQAAGVLNCWIAAENRQSAPAPITHPVAVAAPARAEVDDDDRAYDAWLEFVAGQVSKGFYTVAHEDGTHRTFKVGQWKDDTRRPGQKIRWIGLLTGASNVSDYTTAARQGDDGKISLMPKFTNNDALAADLALLFGEDVEGRAKAREAYAMKSGRCSRCGLMLTVPASLHRGLGPDCAGKVGF